MSPDTRAFHTDIVSFPRVSGDEPLALISPERAPEFSPRERG